MKGKIGIIAKFHRTDIIICCHSRGTKPPSYSRINTVNGSRRDILPSVFEISQEKFWTFFLYKMNVNPEETYCLMVRH